MFIPTCEQQEIITRFCALSGLVAASNQWSISADCFCKAPDPGFRFSHNAIDQIEDIVLSAINCTRDDLRAFQSEER